MTAWIEDERLVAYVDGELDGPAARAVETEMAAEPEMAEAVAALRADMALVRAAYQEPLRSEVPERLVAAIDEAFDKRQAESPVGRSGAAEVPEWTPGRTAARYWHRHPAFGAIAASIVAVVVGLAGANYFAERSVEREIARLEALRTADREMIEAAISVALESHVSGQPARWHNPDSGSSGSVEPIRTFKISTGQWCREYAHALDIRGWQERRETLRAIACREAGGAWKTRLQLGEES
jgi:surface antigen